MHHRRPSARTAAQAAAGSSFDSITLHAFMLTVTVATAVILSYGPAAAVHHIGDVLATAGDIQLSADATWGTPIAF